MTSIPPLEFCTTFAGEEEEEGPSPSFSRQEEEEEEGKRVWKSALPSLPFPSLLFCSWDFLDVFPCNEKGPRLTSPSSLPLLFFYSDTHLSSRGGGASIFDQRGGWDVSETE